MTEETSVAELFSRDPLKLSDRDIGQIVAAMRESRAKFVQGSLSAGKPEAKKSAAQKKGEAVIKAVGEVDLGDLGL